LSDVRFEIARERDDPPVRVLSLLTVPRLGELQGRNGIGKSLSVKLLELLTGQQPWLSESEAWRTLRDRLGPTSVTATGLEGGQTIEWDLAPSAWPESPPADIERLCDPSDRGTGLELRIDGNPATLAEVRPLLRVHRLVGDETLEDSVRARISKIQTRAEEEFAALGAISDTVEGVLAEAAEVLEPLSGRVVRQLTGQLADLRETRKRLVEQRRSDNDRVERLLKLEQRSRALRRLEDLEAAGATTALTGRLKDLEEKIAELRRERDQGFVAAVADVQLRGSIENARAEVERVEGLLERAVRDARLRAAEAGLDGKDAALDADAVDAAHDAVVEEIRLLRETQVGQDAVPLVRQAATNVQRALMRVDPPTVLDHSFAVIDDRDVTGRELALGIDVRLRRLDDAIRDPSSEQLESRIAAASARLESIGQLQRALARQRRHSTALRNRRNELLELTGQAEGDASTRYVELEQQISTLEEERLDLQGEHFRYSILLEDLEPGGDIPHAGERLTRDLRAAGVVVDEDLVDTRAAVEASLRETDYQLRRSEVALDELQRNLESASERRSVGLEALEHTALVSALRAQGEKIPPDADAQAIETVAEQLLRAVEYVGASLKRLDSEAVGAIGAFAFLESGEPRDFDPTRIERVRTAAEDRIVAALSQPVLLKELFGDGIVEAYDHRRRVVTFRPDGSPTAVTRALSAFSSGERVFAYTQMRLRAIADNEDPCENRIVVLDEFGAFLEARRIRALEQLVQDELLGRGIDRVLFVLPLTSSTTVSEDGFVLTDRHSS